MSTGKGGSARGHRVRNRCLDKRPDFDRSLFPCHHPDDAQRDLSDADGNPTAADAEQDEASADVPDFLEVWDISDSDRAGKCGESDDGAGVDHVG